VAASIVLMGEIKLAFLATSIYEYLRRQGQEELVTCSSDYSTRWLAIK
jgi:hypothetical protein